MKIFKLLLVISIVYVVLTVGLRVETASADRAYGWSPDEKVPGYLDDTFTPFLLADQDRTVHAFASQWVDDNGGSKLAIVYRQWTLVGGWTRPVPIILSPTKSGASFLSAYLDSADRIHVIFLATEYEKSAIYYSSAPVADAGRAPAWSEPIIVGYNALELNTGAIVGDDHGNLVIIYSGNRDGSGVYYVHSKDSGKNWSSSLPVFLTYDATLSVNSLRLTIGTEQVMRATWSVVTNLGRDEALYFTNFDTANSKWDSPVELDRRIDILNYFGPSYPAIVDTGTQIVILYNGGNTNVGGYVDTGRPVMRAIISSDAGLSWHSPTNPFPLLNGRSGEHALVRDGIGGAHGLFTMRIDQLVDGEYKAIGGIWHSVFRDGIWSNPDRIITTIAPHDVRAVVSQGNVILTVWREDPGAGHSGIWYSSTVLDIPELPVVPLATSSFDYSVKVTATSTSTLPTPKPSPPAVLLDKAPPSNLVSNPDLPIIVGMVPVVLILISVVLGYRIIVNRHE